MDLEIIWQVLIFGLTLGALYAIIAIGLNLLWGTMRLLNICHGDIIMIGGYIAYWLLTLFGISPLISVIIAPICCAAIGLLVYKLLFSSTFKKNKILTKP